MNFNYFKTAQGNLDMNLKPTKIMNPEPTSIFEVFVPNTGSA